jgi:LysM repeat protein
MFTHDRMMGMLPLDPPRTLAPGARAPARGCGTGRSAGLRVGIGARIAGVLGALAVAGLALPGNADAQTLRGGTASLDRQNHQAAAHDFSYLRNASEVRRFVELGYLVPVTPNRDFDVHNVSFPYARPEVRLFVERLAAQYRSACGEKLVVTSLTRPQSAQPWNASTRSVHPTGMAVDLRRSHDPNCRRWLERVLLSLEGQGLIEAIQERNPPHYHIAVYPRPYAQYVARITGDALTVVASESAPAAADQASQVAANLPDDAAVATSDLALDAGGPDAAEQAVRASMPAGGASTSHRVRRGESLWSIARAYGTTETAIRLANDLASSRILVGQRLAIPAQGADLPDVLRHTVQRGESLWAIARRHGTTVDTLTRTNGIRGSAIRPGQVLEVPVAR